MANWERQEYLEDDVEGLVYSFEHFDQGFEYRYYDRREWEEFDPRADHFAGYLVDQDTWEHRRLWRENHRLEAYNTAMETLYLLQAEADLQQVWEALDG